VLLQQIREEVVKTGVRLLTSGLVTVTWGNVSARDPDTGYIAITPSGMDYDAIGPEDIVILDPSGNVIDGTRKPSSETPMHLYIYKHRPEAYAVVHTHSPYATAVGVVEGEIPLIIGELANAVGGSVKTAPFAPEGTEELGRAAVEGMEGRAAVLLRNHGVVTLGPTLRDAFFNAVVVEDAAKILYLSRTMGTPTVIPDDEAKRLHAEFLASYGQKG